jgi:hypothetical protein
MITGLSQAHDWVLPEPREMELFRRPGLAMCLQLSLERFDIDTSKGAMALHVSPVIYERIMPFAMALNRSLEVSAGTFL